MQELLSKNLADNFNYKDLLRLICGFLLIIKSMLLIVDEDFNVLKNTLDNVLFLKFSINYIFSIFYLLIGLLLFVGIKVRIQIKLCLILLTTTFIIVAMTKNLFLNDVILCTTILILTFIMLFIGTGNITVDKLFKE